MPRAAFARLGGFDERMSVDAAPGGEDKGLRLPAAARAAASSTAPARDVPLAHARARARERDFTAWARAPSTAKHWRRRLIAWRLLRDVVRTARATGGAAVRGRWSESSGHGRFLLGIFAGLFGMTRVLLRRAPSGEGVVAAAMRGERA